MVNCRTYAILLIIGVFGMVIGRAGATLGEDFRVDNAVYVGDQKEPSSQSTTIFSGGVVYDCLKTPPETVVFDKTTSQFVLLSLTRRVRTELSTGELSAFIERLQPLAAKSADSLVKFLAEPKFQEQSSQTGELTLSSAPITYRLTLARETSPSVVEQYREFCDWYARLNTFLVPGSLPPFGRLVVNAAMAQQHAIATQVLVTVQAGKKSKSQTTVRSEHRLVRPLEPADLQRVAQAREFMGSFKLMSFDQYRKIEPR
jgi:hypothetical protein